MNFNIITFALSLPSPWSSVHPIHATDDTFAEEVLRANLPVVVEFWANSAPFGADLSPIVHELAQEFTGRVKFVRFNVDQASHVAIGAGFSTVPALFLYRDGRRVDFLGGVHPRETVVQRIELFVAEN